MTSPLSPLRHDTDAQLPAAAYLRYESRADGWSPGRQAAFLAHLADHGVVADAARCVGKSLGGGYALRRQARGFAFSLGWEAALLLARRIVADRLMAAAIQGEEARWVREDGVTTYTRQNTRLSLTLLDRVAPAAALPEVVAVMHRFDWFLELIDKAASAQQMWDLFFEDALTRDDAAARRRVRGALLLCEESAVFAEADAEDAEGEDGYSLDDDYAGMYEEEEEEGEESPSRHPALDAGLGSVAQIAEEQSQAPHQVRGDGDWEAEGNGETDPPIEYKSMDGPPPKSRVGEKVVMPCRFRHDGRERPMFLGARGGGEIGIMETGGLCGDGAVSLRSGWGGGGRRRGGR